MNEVYWCIFSFQGVGKNKIADRFLHLLNRPREYIQLHRYKAVFKSHWLDDAQQTLAKVTRYSSFLKLNVTDNRLALSSLRHRRTGIKHFQNKLTYKTKEIRPFQKSPPYCQFLSKKKWTFATMFNVAQFTIDKLMSYECLLMWIGERPPLLWLRP